MTYNLSIIFTSSDLEQIYSAGQTVVLTKAISSTGYNTPTAWVVFRPLSNNQVSWGTSYQAFAASSTQIMNGAMISPSSQANVGFGQCIPYNAQGFGQPETGACPSTAMSIINQANGQQITSGLSLASTVNGMTLGAPPLCALSLSYGMTTTLTPTENVSVFLSSYMNSGTVITNLPSNASTVSFAGTTSRTLQYNGTTGTFTVY